MEVILWMEMEVILWIHTTKCFKFVTKKVFQLISKTYFIDFLIFSFLINVKLSLFISLFYLYLMQISI